MTNKSSIGGPKKLMSQVSNESLSAIQSIGDVTFNNAFKTDKNSVKGQSLLPGMPVTKSRRSKLDLNKINAVNMSWDSVDESRQPPSGNVKNWHTSKSV